MNNSDNNDKKYCIYFHRNKINNKIYVGITKQTPQQRWRSNGEGYLRKKDNNKYDQPKFANAIIKYGWDNFEHIIFMDQLTEKEAKHLEKLLISLWDSIENGYNITAGGDGTSGIHRYGKDNPFYGKHHTEETKNLISLKRKELYSNPSNNPFSGKTMTVENKKAIGEKHSRAILQYDKTMNLLNQYHSLLELEKLGYRRASIRAVCQGKREEYKGYIWRYKDEEKDWTDGTNHEDIYCLNKDFSLFKIYKSYAEGERDTGVTRKHIAEACKNNEHYSYGFYWLFKTDYLNMGKE